MPVTTVTDLLNFLTSAYDQDLTSNNAKFLQAFLDGYWTEMATNQTQMRSQSHLITMSGTPVDWWAQAVHLPRNPAESDAAYKLRIQARIHSLYGGVTPNDIIKFVAAALQTTANNFTLVENGGTVGPGTYTAASYTIAFDVSLLAALGFTPSQYAGAIDTINGVLTDASAAGVGAAVATTGGGVWDTAVYDSDVFGQ